MSSHPAYFNLEEYANRSQKLAELRAAGMDPYPHEFRPTHHTQELQKAYEGQEVGHSEEALALATPKVKVAGRLMLFRAMGKNAFAQIQDGQGRIQIMFNRELTRMTGYEPTQSDSGEAPSALKFVEKKIDLGDIIGVEGHLFHTNKGELTIAVTEVTLLCKTLLPLPDKHSGLVDKEIRYRKRWLDLITHEEVRRTFEIRSKILKLIRRYLEERNFMEVETPVLQSIYGGAEARPFLTKLNALDQEMFLRISLEIPLKKLIVGGLERVFELGKVFRNEGMDRNHNPEFTMMEAYASYWDYHDMMRFVEELYQFLALELFGDTKIPYGVDEEGNPLMVELKAPWPRLTMKDSLQHFAGLSVDTMDNDALRQALLRTGAYDKTEVEVKSRGLLIAGLFEELVEKSLIQPHHLIDHPIETTPLCKPHRRPKEKAEGLVERFETFILGQEMCNAYTELNDPEIQRSLLEAQAEKRLAGDEEACPMDEEFLEAICQGMPPCGGVGIGIDRLVMLFTGAHSIRDVLFFPWMRPLAQETPVKTQ